MKYQAIGMVRDLAHPHDTTVAIHASTEVPGTIEVGDTLYIASE